MRQCHYARTVFSAGTATLYCAVPYERRARPALAFWDVCRVVPNTSFQVGSVWPWVNEMTLPY